MLRVKCPEKRGVAAAVGYDQMRVIFNRFESNIESLEVKRINSQKMPHHGIAKLDFPDRLRINYYIAILDDS